MTQPKAKLWLSPSVVWFYFDDSFGSLEGNEKSQLIGESPGIFLISISFSRHIRGRSSSTLQGETLLCNKIQSTMWK